MKNTLVVSEHNIMHVLPTASTMAILSLLTSCDNNKDISKLDFKEIGKDYKIEVNDGEISVHFDMNANKGKWIEYSISSFNDEKTGEIKVYINGETRYEDMTNAKIDKVLTYPNKEEFSKNLLKDASSTINDGFNALISAMFPEGIEALEGGNEWVKGKMERFNTIKRRVNKLFLHNENETSTIVAKEGNSIKTTIGKNEIELIDSDMSVKSKNGKGNVYNLLVNNEKVDYIVISENFEECYATIKERLLQDDADAVGYEDEAKLTGIRLAATGR